MERILAIEEVPDDNGWQGFKVTTTDQVITFYISNYQNCCESWGYLIVNDNTKYFVGAELLGVSVVDESFNPTKVKAEVGYLDEGDVVFVNIETNVGPLQLAVYNGHNGYYSHTVKIQSKQLKHNIGI